MATKTKTKTTTEKLKKTIRDAVKPLTRVQKISNARTHPMLAEARRDPDGVTMRLRDALAEPISAQEFCDRVGISRSTLYKELLPALGLTYPELATMAWQLRGSDLRAIAAELAALRGDQTDEDDAPIPFEPTTPEPAPVVAPVILPWWAETARQLPREARYTPHAEEHETRVAAIRYWAEWLTTCAIGQPNAWCYTDWIDPSKVILGHLAKDGEVPTNEEIKAAPKHLVSFAAYVAGEALDSPRKADARLEEMRHLAAFRWATKLLECGSTAAAKVLARCAHTAASHETAHAINVAIKALVDREDQRRLDERLNKQNDTAPMSEEIYAILSVAL